MTYELAIFSTLMLLISFFIFYLVSYHQSIMMHGLIDNDHRHTQT